MLRCAVSSVVQRAALCACGASLASCRVAPSSRSSPSTPSTLQPTASFVPPCCGQPLHSCTQPLRPHQPRQCWTALHCASGRCCCWPATSRPRCCYSTAPRCQPSLAWRRRSERWKRQWTTLTSPLCYRHPAAPLASSVATVWCCARRCTAPGQSRVGAGSAQLAAVLNTAARVPLSQVAAPSASCTPCAEWRVATLRCSVSPFHSEIQKRARPSSRVCSHARWCAS